MLEELLTGYLVVIIQAIVVSSFLHVRCFVGTAARLSRMICIYRMQTPPLT